LRRVASAWEDHCIAMRRLGLLFLYLDRTHLARRGAAALPDAPRSIWQCGLTVFRAAFRAMPEVQERVLYGALVLVDDDRRRRVAGHAEREKTEAIDGEDECGSTALLGRLGRMLLDLGEYAESFEPRLLDRTAAFYHAEGEEMLRRLPVAEYLAHCDRRLDEERARCNDQLSRDTAPELLVHVRRELVKRHVPELLRSGFGALVEGRKLEDLGRLYRLLSEVEELAALRTTWAQTVKWLGAQIMQSASDAEQSKGVVPALIGLRAKLTEILVVAFDGASEFALSMKDAFEDILIAGNQNVPAKLLARHVDEVLRAERACADAELEATIADLLGIFRYLSAKDAFEAFFKKDLAKRLLLQRSTSEDAERMMLERLRDECGGGYTSKIEGMVRDIDLSKSVLADFSSNPDVRAALDDAGLEFGVIVLTSGLWPPQPTAGGAVLYPPVVSKLQEMFAAFYKAKHAGKSLKWSSLLGQCTLRASYESLGRKELVVSVLQALVLLLYNKSDRFTATDIQQATGMAAADLHRTLQSLALHKTVKLLSKEAKAREIADYDVFTLNTSFTHKLYRIVVPQIGVKEAHEEEALTEQRLFEDRQHEVDAALVRIMKAQKTLAHQALVGEVSAAVRFAATPADIKRRIESLIEREYLERHPTQPATYNYLA